MPSDAELFAEARQAVSPHVPVEDDPFEVGARGQLRIAVPEVKPSYRIPSMTEIRALPPNGFKVASTFSGCGGSCLGFKMAGFTATFASEFVPAAADTYAANFPDVHLSREDIRTLDPQEILDAAGVARGELDVLEGSPPCASFSTAGKRESGWGKEALTKAGMNGGEALLDTSGFLSEAALEKAAKEAKRRHGLDDGVHKYSDVHQRTDDLFLEYARIVHGVWPKVFVAENVTGLTMGNARALLDGFLATLSFDGAYQIAAKILNAARHGVPQSRKRLIIIGVRRDVFQGPIPWPEELPYTYSIRDAIGLSFEPMATKRGRAEIRDDEPVSTIQTHGNLDTFSEQAVPADAKLVFGSAAQSSVRGQEVDVDGPAPTVLANAGNNAQQFVVVGGQGNLSKERGKEMDLDSPIPTIIGHVDTFEVEEIVTAEEEASIDGYAIGEEWDKLEEGESSSRYFNLVKPDSDKPLPTVTQTGGTKGAAAVTHPTQKRKFTIAELRRLGGFPDDFILTGTWGKQWERIGRAVPPPMMRAVAETIRDQILNG